MYIHLHTHTWKTVSRLWVFWFPIGYLNWVQKGRLCPLWTKVADIGKNWKNWKIRNGLRFLELFMHMTKDWPKMHQQAWIMRKHHDQLQVRQGDQPWYPIQDRSFVAHGGSRMPCAPACKLGTVTKNWTCDRKPFGTGVAPTHKGRMSRKYITRCFQQLWSWKNCSRELQNDSMAKVWETNQEGITKMSPHRGKKCNEKNAMTKMHVHEDIGTTRTATILTCAGWVLDRRQVGKKPFCTYKAPSCVKLLEIKLVGYVYFRSKWARLFQSTHSESEWPLPVNWELKLKIGHVKKALRNRGCPHTQRPYVAKT